MELVSVHRSAGSTVSSGNLIGQNLEFWNGFSPSFVGQQEILEDLTGIAVVGSFSNGEQAGRNGVRLIVTRCVNAER